MNIRVNALSNVALYEQISTQIKALIINGTLQEGELLPSVRALAQELGVSIIRTGRIRIYCSGQRHLCIPSLRRAAERTWLDEAARNY